MFRERNIGSQDELFTSLGDLPTVTEVELRLTPSDGRYVGQSGLMAGGGTSWLLESRSGSAQIQHFIHLQDGSV